LLFLPLAHVFARIIQVGCVKARVRLGHSSDIKHLLDDFAEFRPTFILAVPRVFEKVFNTASQRAVADGKGRVFNRAADVAIAWSRGLESGRTGVAVRTQHAVFDRLVYSKLRTALGGNCEFAISGGAPLGDRLGHFYRGIGVNILEGYGLTETTAATTVNTRSGTRIGTVGRPLPGFEVRIADDGVIQVRGGHVFSGYWRNPVATAAALDADGWFDTGDLGSFEDGYLTITGRAKEILVTSSGKNVSPAPLEDVLRGHALVSQAVVVGDARPAIGALVTLDPESVEAWLRDSQRPPTPVAELVEDPEVLRHVQAAVDAANATVSSAEGIKRFRILPVDLTEASGHLTPTLKIKRNVVLKDFAADLEALYAKR
jgi:long-chain acyl-CoA synthetase